MGRIRLACTLWLRLGYNHTVASHAFKLREETLTTMAYINNTIKLAALATLLCSSMAYGAKNDLAVQDFQAALDACERGIQMEMPRSRGSLRILQSLLKRYQRNVESALRRAAEIKDSTQLYTGSYFVELSFSEAYQFCEANLPIRVEEAEAEIQRILEERKARQAENEALLKKLEQKQAAAAPHISEAIEINCVPVLNEAEAIPPDAEQRYLAAKQKVLSVYPEAPKQFHTVMLQDPYTKESLEETKPLSIWFETCEEAFATIGEEEEVMAADDASATAGGLASLEEDEGPMLPSAPTSVIAEEEGPMLPPLPASNAPISAESNMSDEEDSYQAELEAEYQAILDLVSGDRLSVLAQMKRLPDYVNDEDGEAIKASIWQFETPEGDHCDIFEFSGMTQINKQALNRECPPF